MQTHEYKVVPAPGRGEKGRGLKTPADRFANALGLLMNELARDGWEYLRADTLPSEERTGFTKRTTVYHSVLVFRRPVAVPAAGPVAPPLTAETVAEPPRRLIAAGAPAGRAPAIAAPDEGEAPKLGAAEPRG
ncbi:DUF4177 domain-containing protein [Albidovulum sp.]|jgi:hypothetical protein|uniref:DUF4177 domain-containing protein n=2 Tax=Albidovulum sp. TaxID=1872424 RepID=UPI00305F6952